MNDESDDRSGQIDGFQHDGGHLYEEMRLLKARETIIKKVSADHTDLLLEELPDHLPNFPPPTLPRFAQHVRELFAALLAGGTQPTGAVVIELHRLAADLSAEAGVERRQLLSTALDTWDTVWAAQRTRKKIPRIPLPRRLIANSESLATIAPDPAGAFDSVIAEALAAQMLAFQPPQRLHAAVLRLIQGVGRHVLPILRDELPRPELPAFGAAVHDVFETLRQGSAPPPGSVASSVRTLADALAKTPQAVSHGVTAADLITLAASAWGAIWSAAQPVAGHLKARLASRMCSRAEALRTGSPRMRQVLGEIIVGAVADLAPQPIRQHRCVKLIVDVLDAVAFAHIGLLQQGLPVALLPRYGEAVVGGLASIARRPRPRDVVAVSLQKLTLAIFRKEQEIRAGIRPRKPESDFKIMSDEPYKDFVGGLVVAWLGVWHGEFSPERHRAIPKSLPNLLLSDAEKLLQGESYSPASIVRSIVAEAYRVQGAPAISEQDIRNWKRLYALSHKILAMTPEEDRHYARSSRCSPIHFKDIVKIIPPSDDKTPRQLPLIEAYFLRFCTCCGGVGALPEDFATPDDNFKDIKYKAEIVRAVVGDGADRLVEAFQRRLATLEPPSRQVIAVWKQAPMAARFAGVAKEDLGTDFNLMLPPATLEIFKVLKTKSLGKFSQPDLARFLDLTSEKFRDEAKDVDAWLKENVALISARPGASTPSTSC